VRKLVTGIKKTQFTHAFSECQTQCILCLRQIGRLPNYINFPFLSTNKISCYFILAFHVPFLPACSLCMTQSYKSNVHMPGAGYLNTACWKSRISSTQVASGSVQATLTVTKTELFENALQTAGQNLKTLALRFCLDKIHIENGAFRKTMMSR